MNTKLFVDIFAAALILTFTIMSTSYEAILGSVEIELIVNLGIKFHSPS